jgi:hypothetical protein
MHQSRYSYRTQAIDLIGLFRCILLIQNREHDLRLCPRLNRRPGAQRPGGLKAAGCATIVREKIRGATAERHQLKRLMAKLDVGDVVVIPTVDLANPARLDEFG